MLGRIGYGTYLLLVVPFNCLKWYIHYCCLIHRLLTNIAVPFLLNCCSIFILTRQYEVANAISHLCFVQCKHLTTWRRSFLWIRSSTDRFCTILRDNQYRFSTVEHHRRGLYLTGVLRILYYRMNHFACISLILPEKLISEETKVLSEAVFEISSLPLMDYWELSNEWFHLLLWRTTSVKKVTKTTSHSCSEK